MVRCAWRRNIQREKSGCSNLRLFAFGAGMAGVGAVALVEEQVVEEQAVVVFVSPVGRGGRPPGGAGHAERARQAIKDGQDRR